MWLEENKKFINGINKKLVSLLFYPINIDIPKAYLKSFHRVRNKI